MHESADPSARGGLNSIRFDSKSEAQRKRSEKRSEAEPRRSEAKAKQKAKRRAAKLSTKPASSAWEDPGPGV